MPDSVDVASYALRIGNVIKPDEYALFRAASPNRASASGSPGTTSTRTTWVRSSGSGRDERARLPVFNAVNDHSLSDLPTMELLRCYYPNVPVRGEMGEFESLLSNRRTREMLRFRENHNWRTYVKTDA